MVCDSVIFVLVLRLGEGAVAFRLHGLLGLSLRFSVSEWCYVILVVVSMSYQGLFAAAFLNRYWSLRDIYPIED